MSDVRSASQEHAMNAQEAAPQDGIHAYLQAVTDLQREVIERQHETLQQIAARMAQVVHNEGRIFLFGTGHSHMLAEEAYYRAGGIPAAVPMFRPMILMLHESARLSSQMERMKELATPILDEYDPQPDELLFVYADSGSNSLPVQMAIEARARGLTVVGVCSLQYAGVAPLCAVGKKLPEVVDFVVDNGGTPGDALVDVPGLPWRVAASSTVVGATIWNCLLVETVWRLAQLQKSVPVIASFNMEGAPEHNESLLRKWSRINPHLPPRGLEKKEKKHT